MKNLKSAVHVINAAIAALTVFGAVPGKVGVYAAAAGIFLSGVLHAITRVAPDVATER